MEGTEASQQMKGKKKEQRRETGARIWTQKQKEKWRRKAERGKDDEREADSDKEKWEVL